MNNKDSAEYLIDLLKRRAPEYLDLLSAETDVQFEAAFDGLLGKAVNHLQKNSKNFKMLDETGLTAVFVASLSVPGLTVTQESHSNGHVDLTIEADHCIPPRIKLGEAKIYDGPVYHSKGLAQLIGRYSTGSEGRGLLITYVRNKDIAGLIQKLRKVMDDDLPMNQQDKTKNHVLKWSFISVHKHSSGEDLEVGHIGCNLNVS